MTVPDDDQLLIKSFFDTQIHEMEARVGFPCRIDLDPEKNLVLLTGPKNQASWNLDELLAILKGQVH